MTLFSRCDTPQEIDRHAAARSRHTARRSWAAGPRALADFMEDMEILLRYATGRDYYDRNSVVPKD